MNWIFDMPSSISGNPASESGEVVTTFWNLFVLQLWAQVRKEQAISHTEQEVSSLMKNTSFLIRAAQACSDSYNSTQGHTLVGLFTEQEKEVLTAGDQDSPLFKDAQVKLTSNLPGFYAMCGAVGLLARQRDKSFISVLDKVAKGELNDLEKRTVMGFAQATWLQKNADFGRYATHGDIMLFDMLPDDKQKLDLAQVVFAARALLDAI